MIVGVLRIELYVPHAQSLKDRRSVIQQLRGQLRSRFNVAVAELEDDGKWQRATMGISTLGDDRTYIQGLLREVTEWLYASRLAQLLRVEEEYL
jgi:uncharacterized protein YlxP (DUF503 family)